MRRIGVTGPSRKASLSVAAAAALLVLCLSANTGIAADGDVTSAAVAVSKTFDGTPFAYHENLIAQRAGYRVYRLTYPSPVATPVPANNTIPADYYLPDGIDADDPPRPAVICLHILAGNFELVHMTCAVLATRGIPAIMFKLPYYGERAPVGRNSGVGRRPATLHFGAWTRPGRMCGERSTCWPPGARSTRAASASPASVWAGSWPPAQPAPSRASPGRP